MRPAVEPWVNENNSTRGAASNFWTDRKTHSTDIQKYKSSDTKDSVSMSAKYNNYGQIITTDVENLLKNYS